MYLTENMTWLRLGRFTEIGKRAMPFIPPRSDLGKSGQYMPSRSGRSARIDSLPTMNIFIGLYIEKYSHDVDSTHMETVVHRVGAISNLTIYFTMWYVGVLNTSRLMGTLYSCNDDFCLWDWFVVNMTYNNCYKPVCNQNLYIYETEVSRNLTRNIKKFNLKIFKQCVAKDFRRLTIHQEIDHSALCWVASTSFYIVYTEAEPIYCFRDSCPLQTRSPERNGHYSCLLIEG